MPPKLAVVVAQFQNVCQMLKLRSRFPQFQNIFDKMAATMMSTISLRAPVARDAFRTSTKSSPAARKGLRVLALGPQAEPSKAATPDDILACESQSPFLA